MTATTEQGLRCAGCGRPGEAPRIWNKPEDRPEVVLTPVFNWHADGRPALLCAPCRKTAFAARKTGRMRP
jgi:hypothetical protein